MPSVVVSKRLVDVGVGKEAKSTRFFEQSSSTRFPGQTGALHVSVPRSRIGPYYKLSIYIRIISVIYFIPLYFVICLITLLFCFTLLVLVSRGTFIILHLVVCFVSV